MRKEPQVRVACDRCGAVRVALSRVILRECVDNDRWSCCFRCPICMFARIHETSDRASVELLVAIGVRVERWQLPSEPNERLLVGPPFTWDDVLDFHLFLARDDWYSVLLPEPTRRESGTEVR